MAKPKFGNKEQVKGKVLKRARKRAQRLIAGKKMPAGVSPRGGITGREARAIKKAHAQLKGGGGGGKGLAGISERAGQRAESIPTIPGLDYSDDKYTRKEAQRIKRHWIGAGRPQPYDPLKRLSGRSFADELKAAEEYEFGDERRALDREGRRLEQQEANTGTYYDDYRDALAKAVSGIRDAADSTAAAQKTAADVATQQDRERLAANDAEDAAVAAKFGRPATPSQEGARAVEARNFMSQAEAARMRERGLERVAEAQKNEPLALLSKAQAIAREDARQRANFEDKRGLEKKAGAFRTKYRADTRQSEREWEAVKKEFKLQAGETKAENKLKKQELKIERLKSFNQLKQAILYAGADRKMAKAIMTQARRMADAKVISSQQQKEIARIYANADITSSENYAGAMGGKGGGGTKLQPWEKNRVDNALSQLNEGIKAGKVQQNSRDYSEFIKKARKNGVEPQYARRAWRIAWKRRNKRTRQDQRRGRNRMGPNY